MYYTTLGHGTLHHRSALIPSAKPAHDDDDWTALPCSVP